MAAYDITALDVKSAIDRENIELPSGNIEGDKIELTIRTLGLLTTTDEFDNLIIRENNNNIVRLRDIGHAELGPENHRNILKRNGIPMVSVVIIPQPGANQINISNEVQKRLQEMEKDMPDDITLNVV